MQEMRDGDASIDGKYSATKAWETIRVKSD